MRCLLVLLVVAFLFALSGPHPATYYESGGTIWRPASFGCDIAGDNISLEQGLVTVDQNNSLRPPLKGRQIKWQIIDAHDSDR